VIDLGGKIQSRHHYSLNAHRARRKAARLSGLSRQQFNALAHWRHSGGLSEWRLSTDAVEKGLRNGLNDDSC
jgi:alkylhydroperoxidase family enzyme